MLPTTIFLITIDSLHIHPGDPKVSTAVPEGQIERSTARVAHKTLQRGAQSVEGTYIHTNEAMPMLEAALGSLNADSETQPCESSSEKRVFIIAM